MPRNKTNKNKKLRSYHFDCGNTRTGTVGFCARVRAHSKVEAVEILASALPGEYDTGIAQNDDEGRIEYFEFYLNGERLSTRHIDEFEDAREEDDKEDEEDEEVIATA
jgi:hypothetical protein